MRNHRKIKMLRNRFGQILGYAFWAMILEYLTEADGNEIEYTDDEIEMFAAELSCAPEEVKQMIIFCFNKELLFLSEENFFYSESLNAYLQPVYDKRMRAKKASETRERRENGKFCKSNSGDAGKTVTEKPEEIKEELSEELPEPDIPYIEAEEVEVTKPRKSRKQKQQTDKILFGTEVRMTDHEYQKLVNEYGASAANRMIQILDNYKVSKGTTYKDDYRAILSWVVDRYQKDQQQYGRQQQSNGISQKARNANDIINSMFSQ